MTIKDVHTRHCCLVHGCKYGEDDDCSVVQGYAVQEQTQCQLGYDYNETCLDRAARVLPGYGDLMPVVEFEKAVRSNCFIDYDGHGYWATERYFDSANRVNPSEVLFSEKPNWATHVLWMNK